MPTKKEKQQIIVLGTVLAVILGVIVYYFHDNFLPRPTGEPVAVTPPTRIQIPRFNATDESFYQRQDFQDLRATPNVPVRPIQLNGSGWPFALPTPDI